MIHFNIIPHQRLCLPSGLFSSCFLTKVPFVFFSLPVLATYFGHLTLLDTVTRMTLGAYNHEASYYEISSCLHLLPPSLACISSSVPYTPTSSAYVRPLKKKVNQSQYRPQVPRGFQEVKEPSLRDNGPEWW